ncbi:hypothetical protein ABB37_08792 [Leptomonas pyrrhocoris]|uniref:Uncharacterized protein n=1 Tax=Leptomonas pyrrhocoris TaxID=157538 RepID=A0A0M9FSG0_LEPPY|nr:hypothetical protein ABB37_08792 [Leptomonas pyrrhocoris]KPA75125.1 hypothetical protein ABB37_08792 [Leptomonas pyrrhocoris]|eukprot:XP_015653564.1 hypothetical protein ABB37_08792 [Leptomonas pyrrhocoris]
MSDDLPPSQECGSAEALDSSYVHLTAQMLLQLQNRNVVSALQTAEAIRALCLANPPQADAEAAVPSSEAIAQGEKLYRGSPAELLLRLRNELLSSADLQQQLSPGALGSSPSAAPSTPGDDSTGEESEGSTTHRDTSSTLSDRSDTVSSSGSSSTSSSFEEDDERDEDERHMLPSAPFSFLAEALTKWCHMAPPPQAQRGEQSAHRTTPPMSPPLKETGVPAAPVRVPARPCPPSSKPLQQQQQRRAGQENSKRKSVEGNAMSAARTTPAQCSITDVDAATEDGEAEAEEAWELMQQQVAKEMERLAVVRKHR